MVTRPLKGPLNDRSLTAEDNMVPIDASLAKVIHEKLKELLMVNGRIVIKNFCIHFVTLLFNKI